MPRERENLSPRPLKRPRNAVVLIEIRNKRCLAKKFKLKTDKYIEKVVKTYGTFQEEKRVSLEKVWPL